MKFFAQSMNQTDTIHAVHFDISKYNLRFVSPANFQGIFSAQAGSDFAGFRKIEQANLVMQALADIIFVIDNQDIVHSSLLLLYYVSRNMNHYSSPMVFPAFNCKLSTLAVKKFQSSIDVLQADKSTVGRIQ